MRLVHPDNTRRFVVIALLVSLGGSGCTSVRVPAIDPTGRSIFTCNQSTSLTGPADALPKPAYAAPPTPGPCNVPGVAVSTPLPKPPKGAIEPEKSLSLSPSRVVAPVGTEVVLVAGLNGDECCLTQGGRPIKWMLSQDSVGHFSEVGGRDTTTRFASFGGEQGIISPVYAVGRTQLCDQTVDRGTEIPGDDVRVLRGQNWISVSSSSPGTSRVTALATKLENWPARQRVATVEWIDAQWQLPTSAFQRAGERAFLTTTVTSQTTNSPLDSWIVKYELIDGAAAGFIVNGVVATTPAVEVTTDSTGRATAEIAPASRDQPGVARVRITVIRPAHARFGTSERLTLASGDATVTWSAPQLSAEIAGPAVAEIDSTATYDLVISNQGDVPASNVVAFITLPPGVRFAQSSLQPTERGNDIQWSIGTLEARGYRRIQLVCNVTGAGDHRICLNASADGELRHSSCTNTQVASNNISVQINSPQSITNGSQFDTIITIRNNGTNPLTNLVLRDEFSTGLEHISGVGNMIATNPVSLAPGQTINETLTFQAVGTGRQCHRMTVTADGETPVLREACVEIAPPAAQPNYNLTFVASDPLATPGQTVQSVPQGADVLFTLRLENIGSTPLTAVRVDINYDANLTGLEATQNSDNTELRTVKWRYDNGIAPGQSAELRLLCRADELSQAACARATVSTGETQPQTKQYCVQITPPTTRPQEQPPAVNPNGGNNTPPATQQGKLTAKIASLQGDVNIGATIKYVLYVKNDPPMADENVQVTLRLSPGLNFKSVVLKDGAIGRPQSNPANNSVILPAIKYLPPNATLEFEIEAVATTAGPQTIVAEATSARARELATSQETTNAFPN